MNLDKNVLEQVFEGLTASEVRTMLWDSDDVLVYADPGMQDLYESKGFEKSFGKVELSPGMSWLDWTKKEIELGIIATPNDMTEKSYLRKLKEERVAIKDKRSRKLTFSNGTTILSTDVRLSTGGLFSNFFDITEQKRQREEKERLSSALDSTGTTIFIFDKDGKFAYGNSNFHKLQNSRGLPVYEGMTHRQWLSRLIEKGIFTVPEGLTAEQHIENREGMRRDIDQQYITETGRSDNTWVLDTTTKLDDGSLITVVSDLTKFKKQEIALIESNKRAAVLKNAMDKSSTGMWIFDKDDRFVFGNTKFLENMRKSGVVIEDGLDWETYMSRLINAGVVIPPEGVSKELFIKQVVQKRSQIKEEEVLQRETTLATLLLSTNRLDDGSLVTISTDITELKENNEALERLSSAMQKVPNGMMLWDKDDRLVFANEFVNKVQEDRGGQPFEVGNSWIELQRSLINSGQTLIKSGQSEQQFLAEIIDARSKLTGQQVRERTSSEGREFLLTDTRLEDGGLVTIVTDVTRLKTQEAELQRLRTATDLSSVGTMIWAKDDKLVYLNQFVRDYNREAHGIDIQEGVTYSKFVGELVAKGALQVPADMTADEFLDNQLKHRSEVVYDDAGEIETQSFERVLGDKTFLTSMVRLQDGSLFQTFSDITAQKNHESELQRLTDGIDAISNGLVFWDENQTLVFCNQVAVDFSKLQGFDMKPGVHRDDMRKQLIANGMEPGADDVSALTEGQIQQQLLEIGSTEREQVYSDGTVLLFSDKTFPDGSVISVYTDITERKKREETNSRLTEAIERMQTNVMFWDQNGLLILANQKSRDFQGQYGFDMTPGVSRVDMRKNLIEKGMMLEGDTAIEEIERKRERKLLEERGYDERERVFTDGTVLLFSDTILPDGSVINFAQDITERKNREEINQRLTDALEQIPHGMSFWDTDDRLIQANKKSRDLWQSFNIDFGIGQTRSEMRELMLSQDAIVLGEGKTKDDRFLEREKFWQELKSAEIRETEFTDGSTRSFTTTRLKDGSTLVFGSDVTELKKREKDLELAKIEADEANEAKSQFLANMSHELRTPLNAVIGLTEMLKEDATDDGYDDYIEPLERIHGASRHLLTLINDVLDLSKIEAGKIELFFETFLISDIMRDIVSTSQPLANKNNNELILENNLKLDSVYADQTRVRQIVLNLVSNACKFTKDGQVTIGLAAKSTKEQQILEISVSDTGIGMSEEQVGRLFQAFTQADSSTTRKYGGTGLGLIITKHLSRIMGGDVTVSSIEGEGTTFTASLVINSKSPQNTEVEAISFDTSFSDNSDEVGTINSEHSVLIIDDDPTVRGLMKRQLERDGFGVIIAEDGALGIDMAIKCKPDAIVLDILMPGMDGWSVLRSLKANEETSSIPVIMASILDEKNRGYSLGAADYLSKPVERNRLISSVEKLIGAGEGKTVFVVEDDDELRFLLKEALSKESYKVIEAENGKVALSRLRDINDPPSLILLDLSMPVMNGFEFLEEYRSNFSQEVPVVVITGADLTEEDKRFLSSEVTRILEKTPETEGTIAGDVAKILRSVRMDKK